MMIEWKTRYKAEITYKNGGIAIIQCSDYSTDFEELVFIVPGSDTIYISRKLIDKIVITTLKGE